MLKSLNKLQVLNTVVLMLKFRSRSAFSGGTSTRRLNRRRRLSYLKEHLK